MNDIDFELIEWTVFRVSVTGMSTAQKTTLTEVCEVDGSSEDDAVISAAERGLLTETDSYVAIQSDRVVGRKLKIRTNVHAGFAEEDA